MAQIKILSIAERSRFENLFQAAQLAEGSLEWFQALAETTLDPVEKCVFAVAFDGDTAKAALPLASTGASLRGLTAPYTTCYAPAFPDAEWARYLGARAQSFVKGSLQLNALDAADVSTAAFLDGLSASGLVMAQYQNFLNFYERTNDFQTYWIARPSRLKSTVRRKLAQAAAEQVEFQSYRDELADAAQAYEEVYRASWKIPEPHPNFIKTMVEKLGQSGFVRIGIMRLRGSPIAAQIWLVCQRRATIFKLAHREDVKELSPGTLLTHWMVSTLMREEGITEIDFGRGRDAYKRDWVAESRIRSGVVAGNWKTMAGQRTITGKVLPTWLSAIIRRARP